MVKTLDFGVGHMKGRSFTCVHGKSQMAENAVNCGSAFPAPLREDARAKKSRGTNLFAKGIASRNPIVHEIGHDHAEPDDAG